MPLLKALKASKTQIEQRQWHLKMELKLSTFIKSGFVKKGYAYKFLYH